MDDDHEQVDRQERQVGGHPQEVEAPRRLAAEEELRVPAGAALDRGRHRQSGQDHVGREPEDHGEVGELLQRVVRRQRVFRGPFPGQAEGEVRDEVVPGVGDDRPGRRDQPPPLVGREEQDEVDQARERPAEDGGEVPVPPEPELLLAARQGDPGGERDFLVRGGPEPVLRASRLRVNRSHSLPGMLALFQ